MLKESCPDLSHRARPVANLQQSFLLPCWISRRDSGMYYIEFMLRGQLKSVASQPWGIILRRPHRRGRVDRDYKKFNGLSAFQ